MEYENGKRLSTCTKQIMSLSLSAALRVFARSFFPSLGAHFIICMLQTGERTANYAVSHLSCAIVSSFESRRAAN